MVSAFQQITFKKKTQNNQNPRSGIREGASI